MSEKQLDRGRQQSVVVPEYFAKILRNKDRIIRVQARRIELLEEEVHRLRMGREAMSSQLAVLTCKLKVLSARNDEVGYGSESRVSDMQPHHLKQQTTETNSKWIENSSDQRKTNRNGSSNSRPINGANHMISFYGNRDMEMLERKYGDYTRANRAALKIQHMYRQYSLSRNFQKLRLEVGDSSRRSQRFTRLAAEHNLRTAPNSGIPQKNQSTVAGRSVPGQMLQNRVLENGDLRSVNPRSPNSDPGRSHAGQLTRQKESVVLSERRLKIPTDGYFEGGNNAKDFYNAGNKSVSPLDAPTFMAIDLPSCKFESLLQSRNKNPKIFCEDSRKDGNWSSSSSSPKILTPIDPNPITTYVGEDCLTNSDDVSDTPIISKPTETNCDPDFPPQTALASSVSCDYDSTFVSLHPQQPGGTYSGTQTDGNCIGQHRGPDKLSTGQNLVRSLSSSNQGHGNYEHKLSTGHARAHRHDIGNSFCLGQHVIHVDLETAESSSFPVSKTHDFDADIICEYEKAEALEIENTAHDLPASSSSSDVGSSNDIKIPASGGFSSEISSGEFELYVQRNSTQLTDKQRKRKYRIGLNLFNRKPEKGIHFLIDNHFLDNKPQDVARFLLTRKGLSRQMIGEYLGNLLQQFNMDVLECFVNEINFTGIPIDKALRKFQSYFRLPGEAQKIEKLMEAFASSYITSNPDVVRKFAHPDTVFLIAYAIIMLNTDLHNSSIKPDRKMKLQDFIRNLRGIDGGEDVDAELLTNIFDRIAAYPLKSLNDHVIQVMKVEKMILGKKPLLPEPHRRLICYCRLYEVKDPTKREKSNMHQREVFLFNDLLLITKLNNKKKDSLLYNYRESFHLFGMMMVLFELPHYKHGVQLTSNLDNRVLITLCASNEADRIKFVEDLNEAIIEVNEMETLRVQEEFSNHNPQTNDILRRSKDSGAPGHNQNRLSVNIIENRLSAPECTALKKSSPGFSNGDVADGRNRLSSGSLDSGLPSVNCGSSSGSFQAHDRSVEKPRDASKFNIFTRKPRTTKSLSAEPV